MRRLLETIQKRSPLRQGVARFGHGGSHQRSDLLVEAAVAIATKHRLVVTDQQIEGWLASKLKDSVWVTEMKSRSAEAVDQMRARGFLPQSK